MEEKENYVKPEMEITFFETEDVITTSDTDIDTDIKTPIIFE